MVAATWRTIWDQYTSFLENPGAGNSTVMVEKYPLAKAMSFGDASSSYASRSSLKYNAALIPCYDDIGLDAEAKAFGSSVRDLLWSPSGSPINETSAFLDRHFVRQWHRDGCLNINRPYISHINYANGDESLHSICGKHLGRLQRIKAVYDPAGRFDQFFPLTQKPA